MSLSTVFGILEWFQSDSRSFSSKERLLQISATTRLRHQGFRGAKHGYSRSYLARNLSDRARHLETMIQLTPMLSPEP